MTKLEKLEHIEKFLVEQAETLRNKKQKQCTDAMRFIAELIRERK